MSAIVKMRAAYAAWNRLRAQGGRDAVANVFSRIVEDYRPYSGADSFAARPGRSDDAPYTSVIFGQRVFVLHKQNVLDVLTAIAGRDRRIAELEVEVARLKRDLTGWPTEHESDCPALAGGECRCPMGNL